MTHVLLNELNSTKEDWTIQVRLIRLWEAINFKSENSVLGLEMVFADTAGGSIQAWIRKNQITKFRPMLEEGKVYVIRNFKIKLSTLEYKVVPCEKRIFFDRATQVEVNNEPSHIPTHTFFFASLDTHRARINNNFILTDIIGCVAGRGDIEYLDPEQKRMKRIIELSSAREGGHIMRVTLWGNLCSVFDSPTYTCAPAPVVAVITSTTIKRFSGELAYGSTTTTRVYFNPAIPEATVLKTRFEGGPHNVRALEGHQRPVLPINEQMMLNRRTIRDLLEIITNPDTKEYVYTVLATISSIDGTHGWSYISCACKKKVEPRNGSFYCSKCDRACEYPTIRYKIQMKVTDVEGDTTTFVLFDEEAHHLLGRRASAYIAQLGAGSTQIPADILCLKGRTYVFKLRLTNFNLDDGQENFNITKIFDVEQIVQGQTPTATPAQATVLESKKRSASVSAESHIANDLQATIMLPPVIQTSSYGSKAGPSLLTPHKDNKKPKNIN